MGKSYIGIDPGSKGFITVMTDSKTIFLSIEDNDLYRVSEFLETIKKEYSKDGIVCVMEDVAAIFGASAKSTFNFGMNKGQLLALLCAYKIPYVLVKPQVWQKKIWIDSDKEYKAPKKVDPKATTINAIKRLFPELDLRKNDRCKNICEDKCDSIAICEFGRRMNY